MIFSAFITGFLAIAFGVIFFGVGREPREDFAVGFQLSCVLGLQCGSAGATLNRSCACNLLCPVSTGSTVSVGRLGECPDIHNDGSGANGTGRLLI